jgi:ATP-dependent DNA helicase RecQ
MHDATTPVAPITPESLGLSTAGLQALPDATRRQVARFFLRWGQCPTALSLLPEAAQLPRDRYDRCRALAVTGDVQAAQELARDLVNDPDAGPWGHRAVGEVFLAMERASRADERFRAGGDAVGRARAHLLLDELTRALELLRGAAPEDPEANLVRLEALRRLGEDTAVVEDHLREYLEEELAELRETVGEGELTGPPPTDREALTAALSRIFGYSDFRAGQLDVIVPLMQGRSVLGLMPTGAGKSICFQLPAALLPGATVVISPLIALMKDQVDGLPSRLFRRATLINSSLEPGEADRRMEAMASGEVSLIYAAPERLRQRSFVQALKRRGVSLFVIDEAHCVSLWGHDFRPDYFFIRDVLQDLGRPTVLALTATATPEMQDDISRQLDVPLERVNLGTFRPNLRLSVQKVNGDPEKWSAVLNLLREEHGPAIIYVDRRKLAEELAAKLRQEGIAADAYHAGIEREARDRTQSRFMLGETRVMAATVAFGMGVDKADVRLVIHYNLPRSLEAYYQEAGRAGRDGLPARCVLLYSSYDKSNLTRRTNQDRLQAGEIASLYRTISRRAPQGWVGVPAEELEREAGDATRVRVGISLLQGIGAVERGYDLPGTIWMVATGRDRAADAATAGPFRHFAASLGLNGRPLTLTSAKVAAAAGVPLEALEPLLLDWQERGWIRFRSGARGMGIRAANVPGFDLELARALKRMGEMDVRRLELLGKYLLTAQCRQEFVSLYFGRPLPEGCGVCDSCLRTASGIVAEGRPGQAARLDDAPRSDEESHLFELLRAWRREKAREENVAAYVIFHDRVLYEIARIRPKTLPALGDVPGVGRSKLQAFGNEILALLRQGE